jgi:hypothetical protein
MAFLWYDWERKEDEEPYFDEDACKDPPNLDEQMNSPEFRLAALEMWVQLWTPRIQQMEKMINGSIDYPYHCGGCSYNSHYKA